MERGRERKWDVYTRYCGGNAANNWLERFLAAGRQRRRRRRALAVWTLDILFVYEKYWLVESCR